MTRSHRTTASAVAFAMAATLVAPPASAQTPPDLRDLIGARAGQAEGAVRSRGYDHVRTQSGGNSSYAYWSRGGSCVQITTNDGRYASIDTMDRSLCRSGGGSGGSNAAGAVIAGAAIVGLAAALAAHNKKHDSTAPSHDDEYSRGYQDALYGGSYDRNDTEAYHDGYMAGEAERSNRRAANSRFVRNSPRAAQDACTRRGDDYLGMPPGTSVAVSTNDDGRGGYQIVVAAGHYRARCAVTAGGQVTDISPF